MTWVLVIMCSALTCGQAELQVGAYTSSMQECIAYGESVYEAKGYAWLCSKVDPNVAVDTREIVDYFYSDR